MGAEVEGSGTMNFDIPPRSFTVILILSAFDFQYFLTLALRHNPYIIEIILLEFLLRIRRQQK